MMRLLRRRRRSCSHGTNTTCSTITIIAHPIISPLVGGDYDGPRNDDDDDDKQNQNHQQQIQNHQQEVQQQQQQLRRYHHNHRASSSTPYSPLSSPFSLVSSSSPLLSSYPSSLSFSTTTGGKGGSVASSASTFESSSSSSSTEEAIAVAVADYNQKKKEKEKKKEKKNNNKKEKDDTSSSSNPFLDHLGKVFLLAIASVIATLVRSSYSTSNRNKIRDFIEESSVCDPNEIEEFRIANAPNLTIEVMRKVMTQFYSTQNQNNHENNTDFSMNPSASSSASHKYDAFGEEKQQDQYLRCTYDEFIKRVRKIMATQFDNQGQNEHVGGIGGVTLSKASDSFTIESGHIMDRLMESVLESRRRNGCLHCIRKVLKNNHEEHEPEELLPIALFWTTLIAGMNGSVTDRIRILHEVLVMEEQYIVRGQTQQQDGTTSDHILAANVADAVDIDVDVVVVPFSRVRDMVGYLQETCQLPPDTQIVMTETKYPTQQYKRASPSELVPTVKVDDDKEKVTTTTTDDVGGENSNDNDQYGVDVVEFAAILRTKSVCAWGECYMKRKPGPEEFIIDVVNHQNENNHSENGMHNYPSPSPTTLSSN